MRFVVEGDDGLRRWGHWVADDDDEEGPTPGSMRSSLHGQWVSRDNHRGFATTFSQEPRVATTAAINIEYVYIVARTAGGAGAPRDDAAAPRHRTYPVAYHGG